MAEGELQRADCTENQQTNTIDSHYLTTVLALTSRQTHATGQIRTGFTLLPSMLRQ